MNSNWLFEYPIWDLDVFGGGLLIAVMAIVHVYVAHFAVGGGLFLVLTEMKGYRENSQGILDYTKKHTKFFLLLTVVFGGITGVGIWFVISVLSPDATSTLIHYFVFGWATEWVFFIGEIVTLFVYFYTFGKMDRRNHLIVGWLYFIFGWLSLFVINGIVAFMLTPGQWLETGNFWHGIFNPTFLPSLAFRTAIAFMLAGLFGYVTAAHLKEDKLRDDMVRYCSWWLLISLLAVAEFAYWYSIALPEPQKAMIFSRSPEIAPMLKLFVYLSPVIFIAGVLMALRLPRNAKKGIAYGLLVIGLMHLGAFEWMREAGRRPYIIHGYTYSNAAPVEGIDAAREDGILNTARWVEHREITDANRLAVGRDLFRLLCISCHAVGGPMNDIIPLTEKYSEFGMDAMLDGMGKINDYMPMFPGAPEERGALAAYIVRELNGKAPETPQAVDIRPQPADIPAFDPETDEYVLLAFSGKGMRFVSDNNSRFLLSPPANDIYAQLIRRGEAPEIVSDGVKLAYRIEQGFENPAKHTDFWKYARTFFGKDVPENTGLTGKGLRGTLEYDAGLGAFSASGIPVLPYSDTGGFNPYPLMTIEARDADTDEVLATTRITAPATTEMGCRKCHGGPWRVNGVTGISDETADDILAVHDRMNRTTLAASAAQGKPRMCHECHAGPTADPDNADRENLNLSAAIHGFHANYLTGRDAEACTACHPSAEDSLTQCLRGVHTVSMIDCTGCHGKMEDHALGLLRAEQEIGLKAADRLAAHLAPRAVETKEDVAPRKPWVNQPDCLHCHVDFQPPETDVADINQRTASAAGLYRMRTGYAGVMCAGCHGITHAVYPAENPFGADRDNIPPMQHQGNPYTIAANRNCAVCHTVDMEDEVHHPNSLAEFRNVR